MKKESPALHSCRSTVCCCTFYYYNQSLYNMIRAVNKLQLVQQHMGSPYYAAFFSMTSKKTDIFPQPHLMRTGLCVLCHLPIRHGPLKLPAKKKIYTVVLPVCHTQRSPDCFVPTELLCKYVDPLCDWIGLCS